MKHTILITDSKHEFFNKRLPGTLVYYDLYHTGSSPDLYNYKNPNGHTERILSNQIDVEDYESQLLKDQIKEFGVNVGDKVMINESGSGSFCAYFDMKQPHLITKIGSSGNVEFDNGMSSQFRPTMEIYKGSLPIQTDFTKAEEQSTF
jgi:hypothetical protein